MCCPSFLCRTTTTGVEGDTQVEVVEKGTALKKPASPKKQKVSAVPVPVNSQHSVGQTCKISIWGTSDTVVVPGFLLFTIYFWLPWPTCLPTWRMIRWLKSPGRVSGPKVCMHLFTLCLWMGPTSLNRSSSKSTIIFIFSDILRTMYYYHCLDNFSWFF